MANGQANAQQIAYWNDIAATRWTDMQRQLDAQLLPYGEAAMAAAKPAAGESVIDVGCGCGATSLELARRVGPRGRVHGVDISKPMLERARATAREARIENVRFEYADAQTEPLAGDAADLVFSRFGVMFFEDPIAAFANLRRALKPGGRLAFVCWQAGAANPWMLLPTMAVMQHVPLDTPPDPQAPGPFAFADPERVRSILDGAGFGSVKIEELLRDMVIGSGTDMEEALAMVSRLGPCARALAEVEPKTREAALESVRAVLAQYQTPNGVRMASAAWIVSARA